MNEAKVNFHKQTLKFVYLFICIEHIFRSDCLLRIGISIKICDTIRSFIKISLILICIIRNHQYAAWIHFKHCLSALKSNCRYYSGLFPSEFLQKMAVAIKIPSQIIWFALQTIVERDFKTTNYEINLSSASQSGADNFIGIVYRAAFTKKDDTTHENFPVNSLIVKIAPQQLARRDKFQIRSLFLREIYMYEQVSAIEMI